MSASALFLAVLTCEMRAQTRIDLPTQSRRVDFSQAVSTKPVKADTALPVTCSVGEMAFKTDAEAGGNLYGCTATNVWTPLGAAFSGMTTTLGDLRIRRDNATSVTIGAGCSATDRCNVRINDAVFSFLDAATATSPSGTGMVWFGVDESGNRIAWHNLTGLACSNMVCVPGSPSIPVEVIPVGQCTVSNGSFDSNGCSDLRATYSRELIKPGAGLTRSGNTLSLSGTIPTFAAGAAAPTSTCSPGERYLRTDTNQSFDCTSTNTWTETGNQPVSLAADPANQTGRVWHNSTEDALKARLNSATHYLVRAASALPVPSAGHHAARVSGAHQIDSFTATRLNRQGQQEFEIGSVETGGWVRMTGTGAGSSSLGFFDNNVSQASPVFDLQGASGTLALSRHSGSGPIAGLQWKQSTGAFSMGQAACDSASAAWTLLLRDCSASAPQTKVLIEAGEAQSESDYALRVQQHNAEPGSGTVSWAPDFAGRIARYQGEDTAGIGQPFLKSDVLLADQTGDGDSRQLIGAGAANAGTYRVCAVVSVKTAAASSLSLPVTFRSPASGTDVTRNLFTALAMDAAGEHDACMIIRSTGDAAVSADPSDVAEAIADIRLYVERLGR